MKNTKIILIANDERERNIIYARLRELRDELSTRMSSVCNHLCWDVYLGKTVQISIYLKEYRYMDGLHCDYFAISTFDLDYAEKWQRQFLPHAKELTTFNEIKEKITELISYKNWERKPYGKEEKEDITIMNDIIKRYMTADAEATATLYRVRNGEGITVLKTLVPTIKNVIFNDPATIVFWADGTKTVVKAQDGDIFDPEKGLTMAISKKALGNKGNYCNELKKWLPEEEILIDDCKNCAPLCHSKVWTACQRLVNTLQDKKATKADFGAAMEEAIGYLGEALDD